MGDYALIGKKPERKTIIAQNLFAFDDLIKESGITYIDLEPRKIKKLLKTFSSIKDKRQKYKVKYSIQALFVIIILAKLSHSGHNCCEIAGFAKSHCILLFEAGALKDEHTPSHDTIQRFLEELDPSWIHSLLVKFREFYREIQRLVYENKCYTHLIVDGKEFRGSGRKKGTKKPKRNTATLDIYDSSSDICLHSIPIDEKTNEIPVAQKKLNQLGLLNTIVTADALHCQKKTAEIIRKRGGHYVLCAKDNQETLTKDIMSSFKKKKPKQGRKKFFKREKMKFWVIKLQSDYIGEDWLDQKLYIKMVSSITGEEAEPMYFISGLSAPIAAIEAIEVRWTVENALHKKKDFYCNEDKYYTTNKNAIESMAYLNNILLLQ